MLRFYPFTLWLMFFSIKLLFGLKVPNKGVKVVRRIHSTSIRSCVATTDPVISEKYNLPFASSVNSDLQFLLKKDLKRNILSLSSISFPKEKPFFLDYNSKNWQERFSQSSKELVVKAIGRDNDVIIDFTAGLGRDSLLLASANPNCRLFMIEQNPVIYLLLQNALERLDLLKPKLKSQVSLFYGSAQDISIHSMITEQLQLQLQQRSQDDHHLRVSVYLDPMYPITAKERTAQVKKETQILHRVLALYQQDYSEDNVKESEENDQSLFEVAAKLATNKIVVKRGMGCASLKILFDGKQLHANHVVKGNNQRFEVYNSPHQI